MKVEIIENIASYIFMKESLAQNVVCVCKWKTSVELKACCMLGKHSITQLYFWPWVAFIIGKC